MKISRLAFQGVGALPDMECDFGGGGTGRPHDLIVLTGPPASGKTRLVELILATIETVAPYLGMVRADDWMADPARGARVEIDLHLDEGEASSPPAPTAHAVVNFTANGVKYEIDRAVSRWLSRYDQDPARGKREYFPEGRQRAWGARRDGLGAAEQALLRSSKDPQKYSFVPRFLAELRIDRSRLAKFESALELLSPTVRYTPASRTGDPSACFRDATRSGVPFDQLSSSEADAVIIAATAALVGLNHSVVFLDRPELSVPSDRLVAWVKSLAQLGENNQWFIATNDPALAGSVHKTQVVSLGGESIRRSA